MPFHSIQEDEFLKTKIVNVVKYGAVGDGVTDDSSAISAAVTAASDSVLVFPPGTYRVSSNITMPSNVGIWFVNGAKLSVDVGVTVMISGKLDAGLYQIFSGSGSVSLAGNSVQYFLPQWWGATGDGSTDDTNAINATAVVADGRTLYFTDGTYRIAGNIALDEHLKLAKGAILSIDASVTFTVNGKLEAGLHQIFSGSGTAMLSPGCVEYIVPQWWGAKGDGSNDDTSAIQLAIDAAKEKVREVFLPSGIYKITSPLAISHGTNFRGSGMNSTRIDVYGGVNGIEVTNILGVTPYEASILSHFRIRAMTHGSGIGIKIWGDRAGSIEHVWVGGWYNQNTGFEKGILIGREPAYYNTIFRCVLMKNTYNIYLWSDGVGANETRIIANDIWYGDYGIYITHGDAVRIALNSIEGYAVRGVYTNTRGTMIHSNRFESEGKYSVELGPDAARCYIQLTAGVTGFGNGSDVLDNSNCKYHYICDESIPIGYQSAYNNVFALAGKISCDINNYHAKDVTIEAIPGDLKLKTNARGKVIELNGPVESDISKFSTPGGAIGYKVENLLWYSEDFNLYYWDGSDQVGWYRQVFSGSLNVTANAMLAPNGTLTAEKVISSYGTNRLRQIVKNVIAVGDVLTFSVWIKSDVPHSDGVLYIMTDAGTKAACYIPEIGTQWKRYYATFIADVTATKWYFSITPGANYPTYVWGAQLTRRPSVTGTDNSGVNDKTTKLIDTTKDFIASGIDIGGIVESITSPAGNGAAIGTITAINSTIDFNNGSGAPPAVGATVTGSTSGATGKVVDVVITSGSFGNNDATGYVELQQVGRTFTTETVTYTGGSVNCTAYYPNDVLVFADGLSMAYGTPRYDFDNGDTYYACSSWACTPAPYIASPGNSSTSGWDYPVFAAPNIRGTRVWADGLLVQKAYINDNMDGNITANPPIGNVFQLKPINADRYFHMEAWNWPSGSVTFVRNNASSYKVLVQYTGINLATDESAIFYHNGTEWKPIFAGQSNLQKTANVTFNSVIATDRISGGLDALTFANPLSVNMNNANVFTLTTTGDCTINASGGMAGQWVTFIVTDDTTGGHIVTFGTNFKPNGTLTGTANKTATVVFAYNGTNWYEVSRTTGL